MSGFPKVSTASRTGEKGVRFVSRIAFDELGWLFRRTHGEEDYGIDGYFDVVTDKGEVTGQQIAVQIKFGDSYMSDENPFGFTHRGEMKHVNYYANHPMPVIILLGKPGVDECYWEVFDAEKIVPTGNSWTINIPRKNSLQHSKKRLLALLPEIESITEKTKDFWNLIKTAQNGGIGIAAISKEEVLKMDFSFVHDFFGKILQKPSTIRDLQSKIEILFDGVDDEQTELYEVPEYRDYIKKMMIELPQISFFLTKGNKFGLLGIIPICFCFKEKSTKNYRTGDKIQVSIDPENMRPMLETVFAGFNSVTAFLKMSEQEIKALDIETISSLRLPPMNT